MLAVGDLDLLVTLQSEESNHGVLYKCLHTVHRLLQVLMSMAQYKHVIVYKGIRHQHRCMIQSKHAYAHQIMHKLTETKEHA